MVTCTLFSRLKVKNADEIEISETRISNVLDPLMIDPLGRARLKKLKTRPWTADANEQQVNFIHHNIVCVHPVVLIQTIDLSNWK